MYGMLGTVLYSEYATTIKKTDVIPILGKNEILHNRQKKQVVNILHAGLQEHSFHKERT